MSAETATISVATSRDTSAMRGMKDGVSTRAAAATGLVKKKVVTIVTPLPEGFRALKGVKITPWKPDMSKCKVCGKTTLSTTADSSSSTRSGWLLYIIDNNSQCCRLC